MNIISYLITLLLLPYFVWKRGFEIIAEQRDFKSIEELEKSEAHADHMIRLAEVGFSKELIESKEAQFTRIIRAGGKKR